MFLEAMSIVRSLYTLPDDPGMRDDKVQELSGLINKITCPSQLNQADEQGYTLLHHVLLLGSRKLLDKYYFVDNMSLTKALASNLILRGAIVDVKAIEIASRVPGINGGRCSTTYLFGTNKWEMYSRTMLIVQSLYLRHYDIEARDKKVQELSEAISQISDLSLINQKDEKGHTLLHHVLLLGSHSLIEQYHPVDNMSLTKDLALLLIQRGAIADEKAIRLAPRIPRMNGGSATAAYILGLKPQKTVERKDESAWNPRTLQKYTRAIKERKSDLQLANDFNKIDITADSPSVKMRKILETDENRNVSRASRPF